VLQRRVMNSKSLTGRRWGTHF